MDHIGYGLLELGVQRPRILLVVSLIPALFFGALAGSAWNNWRQLPNEPEELTLQEVVERLSDEERVWAVVSEPVVWDCTSLFHSVVLNDMSTDVVFTDQEQTVAAVASYDGNLSCAEVMEKPAAGVFWELSEKKREVMRGDGFGWPCYRPDTVFIDFCHTCGGDDSWELILESAGLALASLALNPLAFLERRRRRRKGIVDGRITLSSGKRGTEQ